MRIEVSREVREARRGVVALESTLIAHGLPWPENLQLALQLEDTVRAAGAIPATIAVVDGFAMIGMTNEHLERLARGGAGVAKAGAADLAIHLARGSSAATTVSATALLASHAGIRVFATGGIGGVHRGNSYDVSHDLVALAQIPIVVVSAGAKAILDLPRTLEALETLGVLMVGYQTSEFPAFYSRSSGLPLEHRVEGPREVAAIASLRWSELRGGAVLVCNPVPADAAVEGLDEHIAMALAEAEKSGIAGKRLTPFLLSRLAELTRSASVRANRALAIHNAEVAAEIANAIAADRP